MRTKLKSIVTVIFALVMTLSLACFVACNNETPAEKVKLSLDKTTISVEAGQSETLTATLTGSKSAIEWSSSNTQKATVSDGVVSALEVGTATITAKVGEVTATCEVTITECILPIITLNNSSTQIYKDQTLNLNASVSYDGNEVGEATIVYNSSDTSVATVSDEGVVTGISKGSATITADCTYSGKVATQKSVTISVANLTVVSFVTEDAQSLSTGETLSLSASVCVNGDEVSSPDITYSVSNTSAASISGSTLTALSADDALVITATYTEDDEDFTDTITVSIDYTEIFSSAVEVVEEAAGTLLIETTKTFESATIDGSAITITAGEGGYLVDSSIIDSTKSSLAIIFTDADGVDYVANLIYILKAPSGNVFVRTDGGFAGAATVTYGVEAYDRKGLSLVSGNASKTWQNVFSFYHKLWEGSPATYDYQANGYTYLVFDYYFVKGSANYIGITNSTNGDFVMFNIDSEVSADEFLVLGADKNSVAFAENTWQTMVIKTEAYSGMIQGYSLGGFNMYFDNVRYMTPEAYECFISGNVSSFEKPAEVEIPLANAYPRAGSSYKLTAAGEVEYQGKTAAQFTGANDSTWKNNLYINVTDYKADYDWALIDFYFNSDTVQITAGGNYQPITFGSHIDNGYFYAIKEIEGVYYSVPVVKNQWNTIAIDLSQVGSILDIILSGAVDNYVADMKAVKSSVIGDIQVVSSSIANSTIADGGFQCVSITNDVVFNGKTNVTHIVNIGTEQAYKNQWNILGLDALRNAGYSYVVVEALFQTQGVANSYPNIWYLNDPISVQIDGAPSDSSLKLYNVGRSETTLTENAWTYYVFDLSASAQSYLGFWAGNGSEWYVGEIYGLTSAELDTFKVKPEKVSYASNAFFNTSVTQTLVDNIGDRNGVALCTASAAWHSSYSGFIVSQFVNEYNTFSFDVYFDGDTNLLFFYKNGDLATITNDEGSNIEGIELLDANGEDATLSSGNWYTVKVTITDMNYGMLLIFRADTSVSMYIDNAYFENAQ